MFLVFDLVIFAILTQSVKIASRSFPEIVIV